MLYRNSWASPQQCCHDILYWGVGLRRNEELAQGLREQEAKTDLNSGPNGSKGLQEHQDTTGAPSLSLSSLHLQSIVWGGNAGGALINIPIARWINCGLVRTTPFSSWEEKTSPFLFYKHSRHRAQRPRVCRHPRVTCAIPQDQ